MIIPRVSPVRLMLHRASAVILISLSAGFWAKFGRILGCSLVDELHDFFEVPHAAAQAAHEVLEDPLSGRVCILSCLCLSVNVLQDDPHKLDDSYYKRAKSNRAQVIPAANIKL